MTRNHPRGGGDEHKGTPLLVRIRRRLSTKGITALAKGAKHSWISCAGETKEPKEKELLGGVCPLGRQAHRPSEKPKGRGLSFDAIEGGRKQPLAELPVLQRRRGGPRL